MTTLVGAVPGRIYQTPGLTYTADAGGVVSGVAAADVGALLNAGCTFQNDVTAPFAYNANPATGSATLSAANISGGSIETILNLMGTLVAGATATLPTVAALVAALDPIFAGQSYRLRVINSSSGAFAWTIAAGTGWTVAGTMTVAQNTWRDFYVTLTSLAAATLQSVGTGTNS